MTMPYQLNTQRRSQFISEAVSQRCQISVSIVTEAGWSTHKSRFLEIDNDAIILEYPASHEQPVPEITPLQNVGVSFRRGHKKCMFNSVILRRLDWRIGRDAQTHALAIAPPTNMFELQRRLFHRVTVPEGIRIDVTVWRHADENDPSVMTTFSGPLVDLSAGGLSFELTGDHTPDWPVNTPLCCSFGDGRGKVIEATAQYRYCETEPDRPARIGLQFAGLEASVAGRATLQAILATTRNLQQM